VSDYGPEDYVVVVKLSNGEEIVGLLVEDNGDYIRIEHPYTLRYEPIKGGVGLLPWCLWSEDQLFHIYHDKIFFVVTCNKNIASKYLDLIDVIVNPMADDVNEFKESLDKLGKVFDDDTVYDEPSIIIEGNDTKH
jgi:hypothetical protein